MPPTESRADAPAAPYPHPCLCCDELTAAKVEIARLADALEQAQGIKTREWSADDAKALIHLAETEQGAVAWRYLLHLETLLLAARAEAAVLRELKTAAIAVMRFSTPPDNLHNCYFCGRIPHGQGCAWMGLSDALDAALSARSAPNQSKGSE